MWILGALTVISALGVVLAQKPLNSALSLIVTLFLVAGHFALLGAHFVAAIQVLVYAGAIMVLVIFVIMLLGVTGELDRSHLRSAGTLLLTCASGGFIAVLTFGLPHGLGSAVAQPDSISALTAAGLGNTEAFGKVMFSRFLFPFELTSVLLLAAIIGAVILALEPKRPLPAGRGLKAKRHLTQEGDQGGLVI